jgi:PKD repeat protein
MMKYSICFVLAAALCLSAQAQITGFEYFTGADPGYGKATPLAVSPGSDITKDFTLALSSFSEGFHVVSFRARNAQGQWSQTYSHTFYVFTSASSSVVGAEYFFDKDPGIGKATPVGAPFSGDVLTNVISLAQLTPGFHTMGLRVKNSLQQWSATYQHIFLLTPGNGMAAVNRLDYYFTGDGAPNKIYSYTVPMPSQMVDLNFTADLSELIGDREYDLHIMAVDSLGVRSSEVVKRIKVCTGAVSKAGFAFAQAANQVSFINNSVNANHFQWDYGDGKTDTITHPLHTYPTVGDYQVRLIATNACNSDTITKLIAVSGLKNITTNRGGNGGAVTVTVSGAGFLPGMQLYLSKSGQATINGDTLVVVNGGTLRTTFNLNGKATGLYDVVAFFPGGKRDTLHGGFTIEQAVAPQLSVRLTGPGVLRIGFNQVYTVSMSNSGNTDADFVPLAIGGLPLGTDIEILSPVLNIDTLPPFKDMKYKLDTVRRTFDDSTRKMSFRIVYINRIEAGSTQTLNVIFHVPNGTQLHSTPRIFVLLGEPLNINTGATQRRAAGDGETAGYCLSQLFMYAGNTLLKEAEEFNVYAKCATGSLSTFNTLLDFVLHAINQKSGLELFAHVALDFTDFYKQFGETVIDCMAAAGTTVSFPEVFTSKLVKAAANVAWDALVNYEDVFNCSKAFYNVTKNAFVALIGNAWDPNEKYGSGDSSLQHYVSNVPLSYTIGFENSPAANLNAQTVTVIDTLKAALYDFSTFGFTSVSIGDSVYSLPDPATSFVHDFDFTSPYGVKARVTASFDTTAGVAQWTFLTIDPATNQATANALSGFLPPDLVSPKGQGYVSFAVQPKAGVQDGDTIKNKAFITFDFNPVIVTNEWQNVFDLIKPSSAVVAAPAEVYDTTFTVQWNGTDNAAGIRSYDVFYKVNDGSYRVWQADATGTQDSFTGKKDSTYSFYSLATDNAGNRENAKTVAERVVTIRIFDSSTVTCGSGLITLHATPASLGYTYQWQVDTGNGFTDLAENNTYSGVKTTDLVVHSPATSFALYRYRCKISNGAVTYFSSLHTLKFLYTWLGIVGNAWETPANWSCGKVPDEYTDVQIGANAVMPVVNINSSCKSILLTQGAQVLVKQGVKLVVSGKK